MKPEDATRLCIEALRLKLLSARVAPDPHEARRIQGIIDTIESGDLRIVWREQAVAVDEWADTLDTIAKVEGNDPQVLLDLCQGMAANTLEEHREAHNKATPNVLSHGFVAVDAMRLAALEKVADAVRQAMHNSGEPSRKGILVADDMADPAFLALHQAYIELESLDGGNGT